MAVAIDSWVRERLVRTVASAKCEVRAVLRARIVLAAADGLANGAIARAAEDLRARGPRSDHGHVNQHAAASGSDLVAPGCHPLRGRRLSAFASQAGRILAGLDLKPHKIRGWLTFRDTSGFWQRVSAVCALCLGPLEGAVVLSIDEKTAIAAR